MADVFDVTASDKTRHDGTTDAETLTEAEKRETKVSLKVEALMDEDDMSSEENTRRAAMKQTQRAIEIGQSEQLEQDASDEKNIVVPVKENERDIIDGKEVVARADLLRQREREQRAREQDALATKADSKRIHVESLSEKAQEQHDSSDNSKRTGDIADHNSQQLAEREKNRQVELLLQVHSQFRVAGTKFHFKDQPSKLAFQDKGERMVSGSNDDRVAKAMAALSEAKGWKNIKVFGHPDFQREVWMEASLRGIEVRGYKPTEQDLKLLEDKRERVMRNKVEHDSPIRERKQETGRETDSAHQKRHVLPEKSESKALAEQDAETATKAPLRAYAGHVLEHGAAKFNHDPEEKLNYFVKLATDKGEKIVWGVDLKRAMSEGNVKAGDEVKLEYRGNTPVTVETLKRDKAGKVVGKEEIITKRNQWDIHKSDKARVTEAVASAFIDSKVKDPAQREVLKSAVGVRIAEREKINQVPVVPIYDKEAPAKLPQKERTGPVVERDSERTR